MQRGRFPIFFVAISTFSNVRELPIVTMKITSLQRLFEGFVKFTVNEGRLIKRLKTYIRLLAMWKNRTVLTK